MERERERESNDSNVGTMESIYAAAGKLSSSSGQSPPRRRELSAPYIYIYIYTHGGCVNIDRTSALYRQKRTKTTRGRGC